ncbi:MAG: hypothetical protein ACYCSR_11195 [Thiomonas sp.]|uniref:Uncharacterized protein n=1 Tax=mine drainage metagenome TaxID=410659 RepID=E6PQS3_9ZZZZ
MFVLQKLLARPGLFRSGAVQLAPARPASVNVERPRLTITAVRLASLGIALDPIGEPNAHRTLNRGGRP